MHKELHKLIKDYTFKRGNFLFVYSADIDGSASKNINISLNQDDFYIIQDMLKNSKFSKIDFYIETPGGSGESAEEIAKFLHSKFSEVNFIIAGEAKSAGTILALSGHTISMTDTGSLGPIDAQVKIGRTFISAHDYNEWITKKKREAEKYNGLNPVDAVIISQISPGEIERMVNSLEFAKDLVTKWLVKYKFKNWKKTEKNNKDVTEKDKKERAKEIADELTNQSKLRTHARSLKINDLKKWLKIERIDDNTHLADTVYRIKIVIRLIYASSSTYKLFFTDKEKIVKNDVANSNISFPFPNYHNIQNKKIETDIDYKCPKCQKKHKLKAVPIDQLSKEDIKKEDIHNLTCDNCGFNTNLIPTKNKIELQLNTKMKILNEKK